MPLALGDPSDTRARLVTPCNIQVLAVTNPLADSVQERYVCLEYKLQSFTLENASEVQIAVYNYSDGEWVGQVFARDNYFYPNFDTGDPRHEGEEDLSTSEEGDTHRLVIDVINSPTMAPSAYAIYKWKSTVRAKDQAGTWSNWTTGNEFYIDLMSYVSIKA